MFDYSTFSREQRMLLDDAVQLYLNSRAHSAYDFGLGLLGDANNAQLNMLYRRKLSPKEAVAVSRAVQFAADHTRSAPKAARYRALSPLLDTTP